MVSSTSAPLILRSIRLTIHPVKESASSGKDDTAASPPKQDQKEESESTPAPKEEESKQPASEPAGEPETIQVPQMAESISEGTLKTWMKKVGDHVEADEEIASIETDKVRWRLSRSDLYSTCSLSFVSCVVHFTDRRDYQRS